MYKLVLKCPILKFCFVFQKFEFCGILEFEVKSVTCHPEGGGCLFKFCGGRGMRRQLLDLQVFHCDSHVIKASRVENELGNSSYVKLEFSSRIVVLMFYWDAGHA